jgi:hypothetical protein
MAVDSIAIFCRDCKAQLEENPHSPTTERHPCPRCGSLAQLVDMHMSSEVHVRTQIKTKARRGGRGKPFFEETMGADLFRKTGRWMRLHRIIDRAKDRYHERVTDPSTGEVVHECDERLSSHTGHCSGKPPSR